MAQKEFIENKNPTNLTFKVLQQTAVNPMYHIDVKGKIIDFKNHSGVIKDDSLELYKSLEKIAEQISLELTAKQSEDEDNPKKIRSKDIIFCWYGDVWYNF